jgi:hypothetical protein
MRYLGLGAMPTAKLIRPRDLAVKQAAFNFKLDKARGLFARSRASVFGIVFSGPRWFARPLPGVNQPLEKSPGPMFESWKKTCAASLFCVQGVAEE